MRLQRFDEKCLVRYIIENRLLEHYGLYITADKLLRSRVKLHGFSGVFILE